MSEEELIPFTEGVDICGAQLGNRDGTCDRVAKYPDGRCGYHTETGDGKGFRLDKAVKANRSEYYKALPQAEQRWIDGVIESWLKDAPFPRDDLGKVEMVRQVAIDMHKRRKANEHMINKETGDVDMTQKHIVDVHDDYGPIYKEEEHSLHRTADRLSKTSIRVLKELGLLEEDEKEESSEQPTFIEVVSDIGDNSVLIERE